MPDAQVYTNHHVLTPDFALDWAAAWAAKEIAHSLGYWAVPNHDAVDYLKAEKHGFSIHTTVSAAVKEDQLKDALKESVKGLIADLKQLRAEGHFLAFSERNPLTKRHTNHATGYAGNVIARVVVWEGGTQGLHLSVQVSTRSNRNAD